jgi:hypothetical protein
MPAAKCLFPNWAPSCNAREVRRSACSRYFIRLWALTADRSKRNQRCGLEAGGVASTTAAHAPAGPTLGHLPCTRSKLSLEFCETSLGFRHERKGRAPNRPTSAQTSSGLTC